MAQFIFPAIARTFITDKLYLKRVQRNVPLHYITDNDTTNARRVIYGLFMRKKKLM